VNFYSNFFAFPSSSTYIWSQLRRLRHWDYGHGPRQHLLPMLLRPTDGS